MSGVLFGKTALVTGASRGIGAAIAAEFAAAGARVVGTATSEEGAAAVGRALSAAGGAGVAYEADDLAQADGLAARMESEFGGADIVIANAGATADGLAMRLKDENWDRVLRVNLTAVFRLTRALLRGMIKKRFGRIVALSSVVASVGNAGQANYCAAKAGLEGYCRALAREVAARGVTVNVIAPGFIATDMTAKLPESLRADLLRNVPLGRAGEPADVAKAALFLASDGATYVTGQTLHVNGGMRMQ